MWQPATYEAFREHRERPFFDLLSQIQHPHARLVIDAGCGTGRTTRHLAQRFPHAEAVGVDASLEMLEGARRPTDAAGSPGPADTETATGARGTTSTAHLAAGAPDANDRIRYVHGDLRTWRPRRQADVVVSNAVLHWIPDPAAMVRRLAGWVAPGGVLAIQVPANFQVPSHVLVREAAALPDVRDRLADVAGDHVLELEEYAGILEDEGFRVDAWETTYRMHLAGSVIEWLKGTTLRPHIEALGDDADAWLEELRERLDAAYPSDERGVIYPFTRRFVVGRRMDSIEPSRRNH